MRRCLVAAQAAANLDPAGALDHPVEHHEIGGFFRRQQQRLVAIGGGFDAIALCPETEFQQFGQSRIIFYQQQTGAIHGHGLG